MKKETERWIKAGSILASDPKAKVFCPRCQSGVLEILDIRYDKNPKLLERFLTCPKCGAKNILRLNEDIQNKELE